VVRQRDSRTALGVQEYPRCRGAGGG
jgi:hypothetical protein